MKLTPHDVRRVAVFLGCCPRTVERYLATYGKPRPRRGQSSIVRQRIADALRELGYASEPGAPELSTLDTRAR